MTEHNTFVMTTFVMALVFSACGAQDGDSAASKENTEGISIGDSYGNSESRIANAEHPWCKAGSWRRDFLLSPDSFGPVKLSSTRSELHAACPASEDTVVYDAEGAEISATVLRFGGSTVGVAEWFEDGRLQRVRILSPRVHTHDQLRVGSKLADLRKALGTISAGYDDAGVYIWSEQRPGLSFLIHFNPLDILPSPDDVAERPEVIPDSSSVKTVLFVPPRR